MSEMRSYEAARGLYSFLGFLAWCVIIIGGIVAFGGGTAGSQLGSFGRGTSGMAMLMGAAPGLFISFIGCLALAVVQNGRAAVDTAEYTQQMLKVSRDQLEVSRQTLKQRNGDGPGTFAEALAEKSAQDDRPLAANGSAPDLPSFAHRTDKPAAKEEAPEAVETWEYRGQFIQHRDGAFLCQGTPFDTLEEASAHLDKLARFVPEALKTNREGFEHRGRHVHANGEGYFYDGNRFESREEAIAFIDERDQKDVLKLGGVTRDA